MVNFRYLFDLTYSLTVKELKSKYKSTTLGFLWVLLNPLLQMLVLSVVFMFFFKLQIKNYPLYVFSGLLPWTFFALGLQSATSSLINNRDLIRKVSFPRELLPVSAVLSHLLTFLLALILLVAASIFIYGLSLKLFLIFPLVLLQTLLILSLGLLLSSLDIVYRDVSFILQALLTVWFYLTPIFYPLDFVPGNFLSFYQLNPMVGVVSLYHYILTDVTLSSPTPILITIIETTILFVLGVILFKKRAKYFADWV